jgi:predicted HTH transcriptional regulator
MFGFEYEIVREYPHYFLDYQEHFDNSLRWSDRITSTSGEWSGNLFGFFYKAYNKLIQNPCIKIPFKMEYGYRIDDTPVHEALREALANCLINADYYGEGGVVIKNYTNKITFENPGVLRIKVEEAISGGFSSPRNSVLMKMFNLLDIGERAGSGIPNIYYIWNGQKWESPQIEERFDGIDRMYFRLPIKEVAIKSAVIEMPLICSDSAQPIKSADEKVPIKKADNKWFTEYADKKAAMKNADKEMPIKSADKTQKHKEAIIELVKENGELKSADLLEILNIGERRARALLSEMVAEGFLIPEGSNRNRIYKYELQNI